MAQQYDSSPVQFADHLDNLMSQKLSKWASATPRRGFLARVGKLTLAVVGASLMQALPFDRRVAMAHPGTNCYDWKWCAAIS